MTTKTRTKTTKTRTMTLRDLRRSFGLPNVDEVRQAQREAREREDRARQEQQERERIAKVREQEQQRREQAPRPMVRTTRSCVVCRWSGPGMVPAVVLFRLANARTNKGIETTGSLTGSVCAHHTAGQPLRRASGGRVVSTVDAIIPQTPTPAPQALPKPSEPVGVTTQEYAKQQGCSESTAGKRLRGLLASGKATRLQQGRTFIYFVQAS